VKERLPLVIRPDETEAMSRKSVELVEENVEKVRVEPPSEDTSGDKEPEDEMAKSEPNPVVEPMESETEMEQRIGSKIRSGSEFIHASTESEEGEPKTEKKETSLVIAIPPN